VREILSNTLILFGITVKVFKLIGIYLTCPTLKSGQLNIYPLHFLLGLSEKRRLFIGFFSSSLINKALGGLMKIKTNWK